MLVELVQRLTTFEGYDPEADGWVVLIEESEIDQPLTDLWEDWTLQDIPWEGVVKLDGFYQGIFIASDSFGVAFLIPDEPWLLDHYRRRLERCLDP